MPDENVLLRIRPETWKARPVGFMLSIALVPAYGIGILILAYWFLASASCELVVTEERTRKRSGILSNQTTELVHSDVKNIQVSQGPIQNLMDTGTLRLSSAGQAGIELTMTDIESPENVRDFISQQRGGDGDRG